ncbi:ParA family protein [Mesorhizobium sp. J428]|uniref:ParA family protein n=1 Tax=Mesorhizobium sp. J428 TaxID=2898440 RepID=UPI0021513FC6|nr:ParA family protein [Mesorhizobium sp. J428]MCR5860192.1 ParA family protein [Mesorhizobium sp. J428]
MKTIVLANQKGGVGKSAVACQLAYFFSQPINQPMNKRVLVIDLDHQRNTTKALRTGGFCVVSATTSSKLLTDPKADIEHAEFVLVPGDGDLLKMEKKAAEHNAYASNLLAFLARVADSFDVCIIDTNPNPDIRQLSPLVVADYVLAPIELNQEAIDGIGDLLNHENIGIRRIQATLNKKLKFLGILPNKVEPTPFQRDNFRALSTAMPRNTSSQCRPASLQSRNRQRSPRRKRPACRCGGSAKRPAATLGAKCAPSSTKSHN